MRRLAPLLLLFLLGAAQAPKGPFLVGNWYGEGQPTSPNVFWLAHIAPNGSFEAQFRRCEKKARRDIVIAGTWSAKNGLWELVTTVSNGQNVYGVNHYKTESYDGRKHIYKHLETGFVFSAVRVAANFQLPGCDIVG